MDWTIKIKKTAEKQITRLEKRVQKRIVNFLKERLLKSDDPRRQGKKLTGNKGDLWRYRVGDYRLICKLKDNELIILLLAVGHRKNIYKKI